MDKKTQRTTGIRHQPLLISRSPDTSPRQHGEFVEISHQGQHIPARLESTPLPDVRHVIAAGRAQYPFGFPPALPVSNTLPSHERMANTLEDPIQRQIESRPPPPVEVDVYRAVDPYRSEIFGEADHVFQTPLPPFMRRWWKAGRRDSYELPELASPPSDKLPEVGAPPGKRRWPFAGNMSPADLPDLHRSTLPKLQPPQPAQLRQASDPDEIRTRLMASADPRELISKTPDLPHSRHVLDELAMTRPLASEDPVDLDPVAFVRAVQGLSLGRHQHTLFELGARSSYGKMVEFAKSLKRHEGAVLWNQAQKWMAASDAAERNPMASQLMTLLVLFTAYTPSVTELDEFIDRLPRTLSPPLAHLRKDCLDTRAALVSQQRSVARCKLLDRLIERYGNG